MKKPTPTDEYIGTAVRFRRRELGLTQADLARAIGVTFQQVQKYEKASNRISASRLHHVSQILGVPGPQVPTWRSWLITRASPAAR